MRPRSAQQWSLRCSDLTLTIVKSKVVRTCACRLFLGQNQCIQQLFLAVNGLEDITSIAASGQSGPVSVQIDEAYICIALGGGLA